jgi:GNAT superfamily N-acetyltransferase
MNRDGNWFYPIWEYSYIHPMGDVDALPLVGIWEEGTSIVGAVIIETNRYDIAACTHPEYRRLKPEMLDYAERTLFGIDDSGRKFINMFIHDFDLDFSRTVSGRGYFHNQKLDRTMSLFSIPDTLKARELPEGFHYSTLAEDFDLSKMGRVLHRGFNHPGEPGSNDMEARKIMTTGPHFRPDLMTAIEAPNGSWVTYCGMWYDDENHFGYVEPVATDPEYRRRGLGTATVLESIRKCGLEGATVAYVWTDKPFYLSFGFAPIHVQRCWTKYLP